MTPAQAAVKVKSHIRPPIALRPLVYYPESNGEPMAETDVHRDQLIDLLIALKDYFRHDQQVYVAANLLIYYEEGDAQASVAPDVFVLFGASKEPRRIYKLWEEGKAPDVVFEITSASTRVQDLGPKKGLYEVLGVKKSTSSSIPWRNTLGHLCGDSGWRRGSSSRCGASPWSARYWSWNCEWRKGGCGCTIRPPAVASPHPPKKPKPVGWLKPALRQRRRS